jgi:hypothetical protein
VKALLASAVFTTACGLSGGLFQGPDLWAINESSNDYVVRTVSDGFTAAWSLPAGSSGFIGTGTDLTLEVLDAATCALVAMEPLTRDVLLTIDPQGRADFIPQPDPPAMNDQLTHTTRCDSSSRPTRATA